VGSGHKDLPGGVAQGGQRTGDESHSRAETVHQARQRNRGVKAGDLGEGHGPQIVAVLHRTQNVLHRINVSAENAIVPGPAGKHGRQHPAQALVHTGPSIQRFRRLKDVGNVIGVKDVHDACRQIRAEPRILQYLSVQLHPRTGTGNDPVKPCVEDVFGHHGQRPAGADEDQVSAPAHFLDGVHVRLGDQPVISVGAVDIEEDGTWPDVLLTGHAEAPWFWPGTVNSIEGAAGRRETADFPAVAGTGCRSAAFFPGKLTAIP
jgi:hypothetical protein